MKSQLRLRVLLPLVAVAVLGLAAFRFAMGGEDAQPVASPQPAVTLPAVTTAAPPAATTEAAPTPSPQEKASKPKSKPKHGAKVKKTTVKKTKVKVSTLQVKSAEAFEKMLAKNDVVVAIFFSRDSELDDLATREARAGAEATGAAFAAINVVNEKLAREILGAGATVRDTPTVMVFAGGSNVAVSTLNGYNDRDTVAQAADNAASAL